MRRNTLRYSDRYRELRLYVTGWMNYFALSEYYRPVPELDEWLRRRMRCCYWKQWRWPRTKISHLVSLGVSLKEAIKTGVSSKGPYAMSRTPITQMAMNNEWLKAQGLVSIKDQWVRCADPHARWCGEGRSDAGPYPISGPEHAFASSPADASDARAQRW